MKPEQLTLIDSGGVVSRKDTAREDYIATRLMESSTGEVQLMESICERENMLNALKRVESNDGAPGIGELNSFLRGWRPYYEFSMGKKLIHELNGWIVRRLKAFLWNQWRLPRTKVKKLKTLGINHDDAVIMGNTRKKPWRISRTPTLNFALPMSLFVHQKGLLLLRE